MSFIISNQKKWIQTPRTEKPSVIPENVTGAITFIDDTPEITLENPINTESSEPLPESKQTVIKHCNPVILDNTEDNLICTFCFNKQSQKITKFMISVKNQKAELFFYLKNPMTDQIVYTMDEMLDLEVCELDTEPEDMNCRLEHWMSDSSEIDVPEKSVMLEVYARVTENDSLKNAEINWVWVYIQSF
jgi:hypothetical protein